MKPVKPYDPTTLLLDQTYMPFGVATAKASLYHMIKNHGHGLDANGVPFHFEHMQKKGLAVFPDQPVLRSAPNHLTGEETVWPIPTVFIVNWRFYYKGKKKWDSEDSLPSLREVYDFYRGICQKCLRHVKYKDASRDHHTPRALNGKSSFSNITLMCRSCNSHLGHTYPKFNDRGEEIVPKMKIYPNHFILPSNMEIRKDWEPFLFLR